eukprot:3932593-Rhodomonas_salina.1
MTVPEHSPLRPPAEGRLSKEEEEEYYQDYKERRRRREQEAYERRRREEGEEEPERTRREEEEKEEEKEEERMGARQDRQAEIKPQCGTTPALQLSPSALSQSPLYVVLPQCYG